MITRDAAVDWVNEAVLFAKLNIETLSDDAGEDTELDLEWDEGTTEIDIDLDDTGVCEFVLEDIDTELDLTDDDLDDTGVYESVLNDTDTELDLADVDIEDTGVDASVLDADTELDLPDDDLGCSEFLLIDPLLCTLLLLLALHSLLTEALLAAAASTREFDLSTCEPATREITDSEKYKVVSTMISRSKNSLHSQTSCSFKCVAAAHLKISI